MKRDFKTQDKYTEIEDWELHWSNFKPNKIGNPNFEDLIIDFPKSADFIEIGGFPGFYSIYFKKRFNYNVHLLDYFIIPEIIKKMELINEIPVGSINIIKDDFFSFQSEKKFDIVFSYGFIEHFEDTKEVIKRHVSILSGGGKLLIVLPNLKGMSGWFLKLTDKELFDKHNLTSMDLSLLFQICKEVELKNIEVMYYGKPHIWINASSPIDSRATRFFVKYFNGISQRIPVKNRWLSPLIVIKATK
jgi:SAM-dependent methyltransferase